MNLTWKRVILTTFIICATLSVLILQSPQYKEYKYQLVGNDLLNQLLQFSKVEAGHF